MHRFTSSKLYVHIVVTCHIIVWMSISQAGALRRVNISLLQCSGPAKPHSLSISYLIRTSCISSRTSNNNVYSIDILLYENCHRAILPLDYSLAQCKNGNFVLLHTGSPALEELRRCNLFGVWVRHTHSVAPFT